MNSNNTPKEENTNDRNDATPPTPNHPVGKLSVTKTWTKEVHRECGSFLVNYVILWLKAERRLMITIKQTTKSAIAKLVVRHVIHQVHCSIINTVIVKIYDLSVKTVKQSLPLLVSWNSTDLNTIKWLLLHAPNVQSDTCVRVNLWNT